MALYSFKNGDLEVEYIVQGQDGIPVLIEVKSGKNTKAKSLTSLMEKTKLPKGYKLTANLVKVNNDRKIEQWPIYLARYLYGRI
jgi:hypothetical protein